jgi:serine/threonine-protein kinase
MPQREDLPPSLRSLPDWQAVRLSDESWKEDVPKLEEAISRGLETAPGELELGSTFAAHEVDALVGRGGMGIVYRGPHVQLGRVDAIKVIAPQFAHHPEFRERFVRESRLASSIRHENLLTIYDAGEEAGLVYLVMQLVDGPDLGALIQREGQLKETRAGAILGRVASALQTAHDRGLVHRDVKPGNILTEPTPAGNELVFLSDFGLVREATTPTGLTTTGRWMGTADYVSPEQVMGEQVDARSDIYSLGCVLFQAVTGRVPYPTNSQTAKLVAHATKTPPSLADVQPGLRPELDVVVQKAMARNPDERYSSASSFREALEAAVAPVPAKPAAHKAALPKGSAGAPMAPSSPTGSRETGNAAATEGRTPSRSRLSTLFDRLDPPRYPAAMRALIGFALGVAALGAVVLAIVQPRIFLRIFLLFGTVAIVVALLARYSRR